MAINPMSSRFFSCATQSNQAKLTSILIVDDSPMNRLILKRLLTNILDSGITIQEAVDGVDAIEKVSAQIKRNKCSFDLIIMDHNMPNILGDDATIEIRNLENTSRIKKSFIIAWSTSYFENGSAIYPQADEALSKPVNKNELQQKISEHWLLESEQKPLPILSPAIRI